MIRLALIGKDIEHSLSEQVYSRLLSKPIDYTHLHFETSEEIPAAKDLLKKYDGVSITSPYKRHFVGEVDLGESASRVGALNCMGLNPVKGINTDLMAIRELLPRSSNVVILGEGVMAQVIKCVLDERDQDYKLLTRKTHGDLSQYNLTDFESRLVVNCCSRDFYFSGKLPLGALYWNLNYGQPQQEKEILKQGADYLDGLELLWRQASYALKFWQLLE